MARVMVMDDDYFLQNLIEEVLSEAGCEVLVAGDGQAGLELLDAGARPDLILMDLRMPRLDGWDFARLYAGRVGPKAPLLVLSTSPDLAAECARLGADGWIEKPFALGDLVDAVARYVPMAAAA